MSSSATPYIAGPQGLLLPVTESAPCGPSLEYDHEYAVLLARMAPRAEAQYGGFVDTPEAPGWTDLERDCLRLLLRSRDINVLVWLCRARTRLRHAAGLAQTLSLLGELLAAWPEAVHPQIVIEGEHEPAVRANALAALGDPDGLLGDVLDIVVASGTALRLTVRDVARAMAVPRAAGALRPEAVMQQLASLREAAPDPDRSPVHGLAHAADCVRRIDAWAKEHLADAAPSLAALQRVLDLFVDPRAAPAPRVVAPERRDAELAVASPPGKVLTRNDALLDIRAAREWFEAHEPSSPVAVLLKQAERMVGLRFSQLADAIPLDLLQKWDAGEIRTGT
jgi:type VI secretion system protein ImpA